MLDLNLQAKLTIAKWRRKKSAPENHIGTPRLLIHPLLLHGTERGETFEQGLNKRRVVVGG